jgi:hypothetical protein
MQAHHHAVRQRNVSRGGHGPPKADALRRGGGDAVLIPPYAPELHCCGHRADAGHSGEEGRAMGEKAARAWVCWIVRALVSHKARLFCQEVWNVL